MLRALVKKFLIESIKKVKFRSSNICLKIEIDFLPGKICLPILWLKPLDNSLYGRMRIFPQFNNFSFKNTGILKVFNYFISFYLYLQLKSRGPLVSHIGYHLSLALYLSSSQTLRQVDSGQPSRLKIVQKLKPKPWKRSSFLQSQMNLET